MFWFLLEGHEKNLVGGKEKKLVTMHSKEFYPTSFDFFQGSWKSLVVGGNRHYSQCIQKNLTPKVLISSRLPEKVLLLGERDISHSAFSGPRIVVTAWSLQRHATCLPSYIYYCRSKKNMLGIQVFNIHLISNFWEKWSYNGTHCLV